MNPPIPIDESILEQLRTHWPEHVKSFKKGSSEYCSAIWVVQSALQLNQRDHDSWNKAHFYLNQYYPGWRGFHIPHIEGDNANQYQHISQTQSQTEPDSEQC